MILCGICGWRENNIHKVLSFDKCLFRLKETELKGQGRG